MVNTRLATILRIGVSTGIWGELEIIVASKPAALDKPRSASVPIGLRVRFQPPSRSELSRRRQSQRSRDQSVRNGPARAPDGPELALAPLIQRSKTATGRTTRNAIIGPSSGQARRSPTRSKLEGCSLSDPTVSRQG